MRETMPLPEQKESGKKVEKIPTPEKNKKLKAIRKLQKYLNPELYHDEPILLTREERKEYKEGTEEQKALAQKYETSRFRGAWFTDVFGDLYYAKQVFPELESDPEFQALVEEWKTIFNAYHEQKLGEGNPIPPEMVKDTKEILQKVLQKLSYHL